MGGSVAQVQVRTSRGSQGRPVRTRENQGTSTRGHQWMDITGLGGTAAVGVRAAVRPGPRAAAGGDVGQGRQGRAVGSRAELERPTLESMVRSCSGSR